MGSSSFTRERPIFHNLVTCLYIVVLFQGFLGVWGLNYTKYENVGRLRLERIERHLEKINKPAVLTIESPDGDIIDCVPREKQLAFDNPLLKNHKIQTVPPEMPKMKESGVRDYNTSSSSSIVWQQTWHQKVEACPKGTVPVRRTTVHDVLRAKSLDDFGKKQRRSPNLLIDVSIHEYAFAYMTQEVYGTKAIINLWNPSVEGPTEFSLAQIWLVSGSFNDSELNSVEAGWQVNPYLYGDSKPRLFIYWTRDSYETTGCYNLECAGFVQTNSQIALGATISPTSTYNGNQFDITILVWKDPHTGNWWLSWGNNMVVGYWPEELFTSLAKSATRVEWGGEVVNLRTNGGHTTTQMGSGHFADEGFGKASYFKNLQIVNSNNQFHTLSSSTDITVLAKKPKCYNIINNHNDQMGAFFYYGGPGKNPDCP